MSMLQDKADNATDWEFGQEMRPKLFIAGEESAMRNTVIVEVGMDLPKNHPVLNALLVLKWYAEHQDTLNEPNIKL